MLNNLSLRLGYRGRGIRDFFLREPQIDTNDPTKIILTFRGLVTATDPAAGWSYRIGNTAYQAVTAATIDGNRLILTMDSEVDPDDAVYIKYNDVTGNTAVDGELITTERKVANNLIGGQTTEEIEVDFSGYSEIAVSSIDTLDIEFHTHGLDNGVMEAPYLMQANMVATVTGNRLHSSKPIDPYRFGDYHWVVTHEDGTDIEYHGETKTKLAENLYITVNPYKDQREPEFGHTLWQAGRYRFEGTARFPDGNGGYVTRTVTKYVDIAPNTQTKIYIDSVNGNNANDGLAPQSFGLTAAATYDANTGRITETGKFASYNHGTEAGVYLHQRTDKIYVNGQLRNISAKIDNNTVELAADHRTGMTATNLTESTGAKQALIDGDIPSNHAIFFRNGQEHRVPIIDPHGDRDFKSFHGYGAGAHAIIKAGNSVGLDYIFKYKPNATGSNSVKALVYDTIHVDGEWKALPIRTYFGRQDDTELSKVTFNNVRTTRNRASNCSLVVQAYSSNKRVDILYTNNLIDNTESPIISNRIEAVSAGASEVVLKTDFDIANFPVNSQGKYKGTLKIRKGTDDWHYHQFSLDMKEGDMRTLRINHSGDLPGNASLGVRQTTEFAFADNTEVQIRKKGSNTLYTETTSAEDRLTMIGNSFSSEVISSLFDHHVYPSMKGSHNLFWSNYVEVSINVGHMLNMNSATRDLSFTCVRDNYTKDNVWFVDASNAKNRNTPDFARFKHVRIINNIAANTKRGFSYATGCMSAFVRGNKCFGVQQQDEFSMMIFAAPPVVDPADSDDDWDFVFQKNFGEGLSLYRNVSGSNVEIAHIEAIGNQIRALTKTNNQPVIESDTRTLAGGRQHIFKDNQISVGDLNRLVRVNGVRGNIGVLNAMPTSSGNTSDEFDWIDGAAGNFEPNKAPKLRQNALQSRYKLTLNRASEVDFTSMFFGEAPMTFTLSGAGFSMPSGLSIVDGKLVGTPTTTTDQTVTLTATNQHGSFTTPAFDLATGEIRLHLRPETSLTFNSPNQITSGHAFELEFSQPSPLGNSSTNGAYMKVGNGDNSNWLNLYHNGLRARRRYNTVTFIPFDGQALWDGQLHTLRLTMPEVGQTITATADGTTHNATEAATVLSDDFFSIVSCFTTYFSGELKRVKFIDLNDSSNDVEWLFDTPFVDRDVVNATTGTGTLTAVGIATEDWY